jgi:vacuolar-type H+-ATPase subunit H
MQDDPSSDSTRNDLLERLKALESQASDSLAELAYHRAREALEKALDDSRAIRLQAIDDARNQRERELVALTASLNNLRHSAETQINELLDEARLEAESIRDDARREARNYIEDATTEAATLRTEAATLRAAAEERIREIEEIEADFDEQLERIAKRLGMRKPGRGLFRR